MFTYSFFDSINEANSQRLICYVLDHMQQIDQLQINISSLGGSVSCGITLYNFLKSLPFPVSTHNLGEVTSAAMILYLSGSTRTSENIVKFTVHPCSLSMNGTFSYYKIEELLNGLNADIRSFHDIIDKETGSMRKLHDIDSCLRYSSLVLSKQEAFDCGIVTKM